MKAKVVRSEIGVRVKIDRRKLEERGTIKAKVVSSETGVTVKMDRRK